MLSVPKAGWSTLSIEDFKFDVSYITDIPRDFTKALLVALEQNINTMVVVDGEDKGECNVVFDVVNNIVTATYLNLWISSEYRTEKEFYDTSVLYFAEKFIEDIEQNVEAWSYWNVEYENVITEEFEKLKKIVAKKKTEV